MKGTREGRRVRTAVPRHTIRWVLIRWDDWRQLSFRRRHAVDSSATSSSNFLRLCCAVVTRVTGRAGGGVNTCAIEVSVDMDMDMDIDGFAAVL